MTTAPEGEKNIWDSSQPPAADHEPNHDSSGDKPGGDKPGGEEPDASRIVLPLGARSMRIRRRPSQPAPNQSAPKQQEEPAPELYYPNLKEWFNDYFASAYRRSFLGQQLHWCSWWWLHPEAVSRLEAMWRAWEHLRLDPALGMSTWWREHVDNHMAALTHPEGTFKACQPGSDGTAATHRLQQPLPHETHPAPPEESWKY